MTPHISKILLAVLIAVPLLCSAKTYNFQIYMPGMKASVQSQAAAHSYASCAAILTATPAASSGPYTLTINGVSVPTYCDMTTDGGGWTLVGNQVPGQLGWADTTADINASSFGTLTNSWRYGNSNIQSFSPTVAWRITVDIGTLSFSEKDYFSPSCVINWTSTWNASTQTNSMPLACQVGYSSTALTTALSAYTTFNSSLGIGMNNYGSYCSVRFANISSLMTNEAYSCNSSTSGHMELWAK
jgi:hypothetical protein